MSVSTQQPISFGLLKAVFTSEHVPSLLIGTQTHEPALRFVGQLVHHTQDEAFIRQIVAAALPEAYAGNTMDEVPGMVRDALRKGFDSTPAKAAKKPDKPSVVDEIRNSGAELFHDRSMRGYLRVPTRGGLVANLLIGSRAAESWIREFWFRKTGRALATQTLKDAQATLQAIAEFDGPEEVVSLRIGGDLRRVVIDLGRADGQVVDIGPDGWDTRNTADVRHWRSRDAGELPLPERTASLNRLRELLNLDERSWHLVLGFMLSSLRPAGPYFCLLVEGEQGSGKSLLCSMIKRVLDPNEADRLRLPRSDVDLMVQARQQHLLVYDNISGMRSDMSDSLCTLATGGALSRRALYTDEEQHVFKACRPFILNGIADFVTRPDLLERAIVLNLRSMQADARKTEAELWAEFEDLLPGLLGHLYSGVSLAIRNHAFIDVPASVRMIDGGRWITAAESALGLVAGTILEAISGTQDLAMAERVELDPVISYLVTHVEKNGEFKGTVGLLLERMGESFERRDRNLPPTAAHLSRALKRLKPAAERVGLCIEFGDHQRQGRIIRIFLKGKEGAKAVIPPSAEGGY